MLPSSDLVSHQQLRARSPPRAAAQPVPAAVKCTSPWIAPGWLVPTPSQGPSEDTSLWWTVFQPSENGWNDDEKFSGHRSSSNPALAGFQGRLHLVHRGGTHDDSLWAAVYDAQTGWSADTRLPGHSSSVGPALAVFSGKLHCVHRGHGNGDRKLWWATYKNSSGWSADRAHHSPRGHGVDTAAPPPQSTFAPYSNTVRR